MSRASGTTIHTRDGKAQPPISSNTKKVIETLVDSVKALSTDPAIENILDAAQKVPILEEQIKRRDDQDEIHTKTRMKALDDYNNHRDEWMTERQHFESEIKTLQEELLQREKKIKSLESTGLSQTKSITELEAASARQKREVESNRKQIQGLVKAVESDRKERAKSQAILEECNAQITQVENERDSLQRKFLVLQKQAEWDAQELQAAAELAVPLRDDEQVMEKLDAIWLHATTTTCSFFSRNVALDSPKTKAFWARLECSGPWSRSVPVPQSNSDAAKQMRSVMILASLARTFADNLFQPTYLLPQSSGIREILLYQARYHGAKEAAVRAHLRALLPDRQESACSQRIAETCDTFMELVEGLLSGTEETEFRKSLQALAEDATEVWQEICRYTDAVEPSFELWHYNNWSWKELVFHADQPEIRDQESSRDSQEDQPIFVIFPRLYVWYDGDRNPETHGVLFTKSQMSSAIEEVERLPPSPRFERNQSVRDRPSRRRPASAGASSAQDVPTGQPFLGRGFSNE